MVILTISVTAWMQTCVPFCGAKKMVTGQWKAAWANTTIPLDMQGSMDTTIDPCDDFYKFACGGFIEHTGIKKDQVHPKHSTLDPQPSTFNPQLSTLNPQPQSPNPKLQPQTTNPEPKTPITKFQLPDLKPKRQTLNPKPRS